MAKYHINDQGNPGLCRADPSKPNSRGCRFNADESEHYATKEEAAQAFEAKMEAAENSPVVKDPTALTEELGAKVIRPEGLDFDTIAKEVGWIKKWEKPWTKEEIENLQTVEKVAAITERDPFTESDEREARKLLAKLHPAVEPQQTGSGWSSADPNANNWRARDKMLHKLGDNLVARRLADSLHHEPADPIDNPRLLGLQSAQEFGLKLVNRPESDFYEGPTMGDVEGDFQEAIARVKRGDDAAPATLLKGTDELSLLPPSERLFNKLHPESKVFDSQLYLSSVYPVNELKDEMDRVGIDGVSVSSLDNGRERGNIYTVMKPDGGTRSFSVYEHRNSDSIIINGKDNWDGDGIPYAADSKNAFFAEFAPEDRKRSAQALTFYMMQAQSGTLENDEELTAKASHRDWNAILDAQLPGFKSWRQSQITDRYIAPEQESEEDVLKRLDF